MTQGPVVHKSFFVGTIFAEFRDKPLLENLGIRLGRYNFKLKEFEKCSVTEEALDALEQYPKFIYDLEVRFKVLCKGCKFIMHVTEEEYCGHRRVTCKRCSAQYKTDFFTQLDSRTATRRRVWKGIHY